MKKFFAYVLIFSITAPYVQAIPFTENGSIRIPSGLGMVTDHYEGGPGEHRQPHVFLFQDLHANRSVQRHVAELLKRLYRQQDLSLVLTEGAFGPCEVSVFRTLTKSIQTEWIEEQLQKGLLTGGEIAAIESGRGNLSPIRLVGIDDAERYMRSVQAFRQLELVRYSALQELKQKREILREGVSPEVLAQWDRMIRLVLLRLPPEEWTLYQQHRA